MRRKDRQVTRTACLGLLVAALALGCASGPPTVRRVFLSQALAEGGFSYKSDPGWGTPTEQFDVQQDRGYLYIVFNDARAHTAQLAVKRVDTGMVALTTAQKLELSGTIQPMRWLSHAVSFPIANWLYPGDYVLDLTIDDRPAGQYPFAVVVGPPQQR